jgi:uncharacterized protein YndB with AHSA1/START domain/ketosteroid isomerase-like protein
MEKVYEIYIKTIPERLWEAITDSRKRRVYNFGVGVTSKWTPGSRYEAVHPMAPGPICEGENLEVDPPRRLVQSFRALWSDDVKGEGTSRVTWEIEPVGDSCALTVTHDQLREGASPELYGGWPMILSGLKTLLETGGSLTTPGSLRYSSAQGPQDAMQSETVPASDLTTLLELNRDYIRSVQTSDVRRFDEILADDFLCTPADGSLVDRARFLEQTARPVTFSNLEAHDVTVRIMGDVAIVHARTSYTTADGRAGSGRYTDVWARRNGRWLAVSAHVTRK